MNQKSAKYTWRACVTRLYLHAEYKGIFKANSYKPSENGEGQSEVFFKALTVFFQS